MLRTFFLSFVFFNYVNASNNDGVQIKTQLEKKTNLAKKTQNILSKNNPIVKYIDGLNIENLVFGRDYSISVPSEVKSFGRSLEKVMNDYNGDVTKLNDLSRMAVIFNDKEKMKTVMEKIWGDFELNKEIKIDDKTKIKAVVKKDKFGLFDKNVKRAESGYGDYNFVLKITTEGIEDFPFEVQFHHECLMEEKHHGIGNALYQVSRFMDIVWDVICDSAEENIQTALKKSKKDIDEAAKLAYESSCQKEEIKETGKLDKDKDKEIYQQTENKKAQCTNSIGRIKEILTNLSSESSHLLPSFAVFKEKDFSARVQKNIAKIFGDGKHEKLKEILEEEKEKGKYHYTSMIARSILNESEKMLKEKIKNIRDVFEYKDKPKENIELSYDNVLNSLDKKENYLDKGPERKATVLSQNLPPIRKDAEAVKKPHSEKLKDNLAKRSKPLVK